MERNANGNQNLRKNHGKRWRSEANSSCSLCEDNMERMKEMFPCNHKGFLRKQVKQEEDDDDHLYTQRNKLKKKYKSKYEESKNEAPKVQPIIEKIVVVVVVVITPHGGLYKIILLRFYFYFFEA